MGSIRITSTAFDRLTREAPALATPFLQATARTLAARIEEPRGDPGNTLSRREVEDKAVRLAEWSSAATALEMRALAQRIYSLADSSRVGALLPVHPATREAVA